MRYTFLIPFLLCLCAIHAASADSKRVHVYKLSQQYWDVRAGDTLGEIVKALLPADRAQQQRLMNDIVELNPDAFIHGDPNRVLANVRLWLPNTIQTPITADAGHDTGAKVEKFSWGSVKRIDP